MYYLEELISNTKGVNAMENTSEIITATGNSITNAEGYTAFEAVINNPFLKNIMGKSESTIIRHLHELESFGKFLAEIKGGEAQSMQQASHWYGITAKDIEDYKQYLILVKGFRTTTVSQVIYIIKSYARVAYDAGSISIEELTHINHIKGIKGSEAVHIDEKRQKTADRDRHNIGGNVTTLTKKQINSLKYQHPETLQGKRDALLFCILLDHGLRISDAINLTMDNIDMDSHMMTVHTKKTGVTLNLAMTDDVYNAFCEYFAMYIPSSETGSVWTGVNKHGSAQGTWGKHSAQMEITKVAGAMGIENLSAHDLRHCWTDRAIDGGSDLVAVQQSGGWKSLQMVSRYATKKAVTNSGITLS